MTKRGETITMLDDEGLPHEFTLVDVVEVETRRYAVLQPDDPVAGAVLFRVEDETMIPVDNDDEFDLVVGALRDLEEYDELVVEDGDDPDDEDDDDEDDDEDEDNDADEAVDDDEVDGVGVEEIGDDEAEEEDDEEDDGS